MEHINTNPIVSSLHPHPTELPRILREDGKVPRHIGGLMAWHLLIYALHQPCLPFGARCVPLRVPIFELQFPHLESRHHNPKHPAANEAPSQVYAALTSPSLSSSKDEQIPKI